MSVFAEVSTQSLLGQDGTLANDFRVAQLEMFRGDADPFSYAGAANGQGFDGSWTNKPGTYFWQVSGYDFSSGRQYVGPVHSFVIVLDASAPTVAERQHWQYQCAARGGHVAYLLRRARLVGTALDLTTSRRAERRLRARLRRVKRQLRSAELAAKQACDRAAALSQG